jgi:hypothetical protein
MQNYFQSIQSAKILSSYGIDLIKGGKPAYIGEIRVYNGQKYVRHAEGWIYMSKNRNKHVLHTDSGQVSDATEEHINHFNKTIEEDEKQKALPEFEKNTTQRKVRRTLSSNHSTKEQYDKYKDLSKHVLDLTKPAVDDILSNMREDYKSKGEQFKNDERQLAKISLTYEILNEITKYCLPTDKIVDSNVYSDRERVTVDLLINRDGKDYNMSTQIINAGGWNIQRLHTRYLTDSKLPELDKSISLEQSTDENIQKLVKSYEQVEKINTEKRNISRKYSEIEDIFSFNKNLDSFENNDDTLNYLNKLNDKEKKEMRLLLGKSFPNQPYPGAIKQEQKDQNKVWEKDFKHLTLLDIALMYQKQGDNLDAKLKSELNLNNLSKQFSNKLNGRKKDNEDQVIQSRQKIEDQILISDLESTITKSLNIDKFDWNAKEKTFIFSDKKGIINSLLSKDNKINTLLNPINFNNKTIRLENKNTGKVEDFKHQDQPLTDEQNNKIKNIKEEINKKQKEYDSYLKNNKNISEKGLDLINERHKLSSQKLNADIERAKQSNGNLFVSKSGIKAII